jgi:hypothetical protein
MKDPTIINKNKGKTRTTLKVHKTTLGHNTIFKPSTIVPMIIPDKITLPNEPTEGKDQNG